MPLSFTRNGIKFQKQKLQYYGKCYNISKRTLNFRNKIYVLQSDLGYIMQSFQQKTYLCSRKVA